VLNIVMVGFFASVAGVLEEQALRKAVEDSVPPAFRELNLKAFQKGFEYGATSVPLVPETEAVPELLGD